MLLAALSLLLAPPAAEAGTLAYSGVLNSSGTLASGSHQIGLRVYQGATFLCEVPPATLVVTAGRFRLEVPAACAAQLQAGSDIVVRVVVDGTELPGTPVASVPFALRAEKADVADLATTAQSALSVPWAGITGTMFGGTGAATTAARSDHDHDAAYIPISAVLSGMAVPPGSIIAFGAGAAPAGWLLCDGRALRSADHPVLFAVIAKTWGDGTTGIGADGSTDFNVPDFRGHFLRGADLGAGRDPEASTRTRMAPGGAQNDNVGSVQNGQIQTHLHAITDQPHAHGISLDTTGGFNGSHVQGSDRALNGSASTNAAYTGITGTNDAGGTETRPINASVNYIIKY
jgi:microcystin-dependent protein